jgi:hypothetical protein
MKEQKERTFSLSVVVIFIQKIITIVGDGI